MSNRLFGFTLAAIFVLAQSTALAQGRPAGAGGGPSGGVGGPPTDVGGPPSGLDTPGSSYDREFGKKLFLKAIDDGRESGREGLHRGAREADDEAGFGIDRSFEGLDSGT
ncbi:MAG: hypothetical protein U5P41_02195 [Gammaproteobacteria bacterium]|nr:hypothetical protein [Gammaproteobacteria bacterium]